MVPIHFVATKDIREDLEKSAEEFLYQRAGKASLRVGQIRLPNLWSLLFVLVLLITGYCLYKGYDWIKRSDWPATTTDTVRWTQERMSCYKQRIDFTIACLAVMVLYGWLPRRQVVSS